MNQLYFGDCLDSLRMMYDRNKEGFIDLVYIDPPFNSKRYYNILFEDADLKDTKAQKEAFADTWSNVSYIDTMHEIRKLDLDLYDFLSALDKIRMNKSMIAYLTTMSIRLWYIHKVLKSSGSFYLHCDPTMSYYLKLVCDLIFGDKNFRSEITWERTGAHSDSKTFAKNSDNILFYSKSDKFIFHTQYRPYSEDYLKRYKHKDSKGFYLDRNLNAGGLSGGGYTYEWKGIVKLWRCPFQRCLNMRRRIDYIIPKTVFHD